MLHTFVVSGFMSCSSWGHISCPCRPSRALHHPASLHSPTELLNAPVHSTGRLTSSDTARPIPCHRASHQPQQACPYSSSCTPSAHHHSQGRHQCHHLHSEACAAPQHGDSPCTPNGDALCAPSAHAATYKTALAVMPMTGHKTACSQLQTLLVVAQAAPALPN